MRNNEMRPRIAASDAVQVLVLLAAAALFATEVLSETLVELLLLAALSYPALLLFVRDRRAAQMLRFARGPIIWLAILTIYIAVYAVARSDTLGWSRLLQCLVCIASYAAGVTLSGSSISRRVRLNISPRAAFTWLTYSVFLALALLLFVREPEGKNKYTYVLFFTFLAINHLGYARRFRSSSLTIASAVAASTVLAILSDTRALLLYGGFVLALWGVAAVPRVGRRVLRHLLLVTIVLIAWYAQNYDVVAGWTEDIFTHTELAHAARTALSGRQIIWPEFLRSIFEAPLWGVGPSNLPEIYIRGVRLSGHNFFLHFTAEFGLIGLSFAVMSLASAWRLVWRYATHRLAALVPIFFVVMANSNEVQLLENVLLAGMLQWLVVGLTVGSQISSPAATPNVGRFGVLGPPRDTARARRTRTSVEFPTGQEVHSY